MVQDMEIDKSDTFKEALMALCKKHDVYIEYDWIEEAITVKNGEQQGDVGKLVDFTMVQPSQPEKANLNTNM